MAEDKSKLYEAFEEEGKDVDVMDLMNSMMDTFNQEKGYTPTPTDEVRIRKMILARKYIDKEVEHLSLLKGAIMEDWDRKIKIKLDEKKSIDEFIEMYLKNYNGGKKLALDVATATLRRTAPKVKVNDVGKAKEFLASHNRLGDFSKAPELDVTLLQNSYMVQFKKRVEAEAKVRIAKESEESKTGKITKKREGEIMLEIEHELAPDYFSKLPEFLDYTEESQSLSITMK